MKYSRVLLLSVFLLCAGFFSVPIFASGTVANANGYFVGSGYQSFYITASSGTAACAYFATSTNTVTSTTQVDATHWTCKYWDSHYSAASSASAVFYSYGCPKNSAGTTTCTCNTGYVPSVDGKSCVPASTCPIDPLTPLTDPVALDFDTNPGHRWRPDLLSPVFQEHLTCVENGITARGGKYVGTSAYRPTQYQQHLFEIVQKDKELYPGYMTAHPECQALRDEITQEMGKDKGPPPGHGLKFNQPVAPPGSSRHESGTAFDLTPSGLTGAQLAPIYSGCGVTHTAVPGEPWHTQ